MRREIDELQGTCDNKIFICGAYSIPGMGLLEQGVRSADKVVEKMFRGWGENGSIFFMYEIVSLLVSNLLCW